ncbi:MAG: hypothetical protein AB1Z98_10410 [Nannocystaceae bacterium]
MKTRFSCVTGSLLLTLGVACAATGSESDGSGQDPPSPPECAVTELEVDERDCGTYRIIPCEIEPEGTDSAGQTGTTGGTGDSAGAPDECAVQEAANAAVVSCIIGAEADGVGMTFEVDMPWDFFSSRRSQYHVGADGGMWRSYNDRVDTCELSGVEVYGAVGFGSCSDWPCIENELGTAVLVATCASQENCGFGSGG